jgi:hypothetical protein
MLFVAEHDTVFPRANRDGPSRPNGGHASPVLPAHAGMDPWPARHSPGCSAAPRARGDGPLGTGAHHPIDALLPRVCWDGPQAHHQVVEVGAADPEARGFAESWTWCGRNMGEKRQFEGVSPAR